jgi:hypothetical protein
VLCAPSRDIYLLRRLYHDGFSIQIAFTQSWIPRKKGFLFKKKAVMGTSNPIEICGFELEGVSSLYSMWEGGQTSLHHTLAQDW